MSLSRKVGHTTDKEGVGDGSTLLFLSCLSQASDAPSAMRAHRSKTNCEATFRSRPPTDLSPLRTFEQDIRGRGFGIRYMTHPWSTSACD